MRLAINRFKTLKSGEDEDRGLSQTRFGLTNYVRSNDCLWNAGLLDCLVVARQL